MRLVAWLSPICCRYVLEQGILSVSVLEELSFVVLWRGSSPRTGFVKCGPTAPPQCVLFPFTSSSRSGHAVTQYTRILCTGFGTQTVRFLHPAFYLQLSRNVFGDCSAQFSQRCPYIKTYKFLIPSAPVLDFAFLHPLFTHRVLLPNPAHAQQP